MRGTVHSAPYTYKRCFAMISQTLSFPSDSNVVRLRRPKRIKAIETFKAKQNVESRTGRGFPRGSHSACLSVTPRAFAAPCRSAGSAPIARRRGRLAGGW